MVASYEASLLGTFGGSHDAAVSGIRLQRWIQGVNSRLQAFALRIFDEASERSLVLPLRVIDYMAPIVAQ
ncbi:hypothetical protein CF68_33700 [Cupriavidus sp. SK-4]|jgi:hypothetical protein|nr:hypothetical protein CF68_33700 [Cupriavidus sp. SK-4]